MPSRTVTYVHRPKRPPRNRKASVLGVRPIVATASRKQAKFLRAAEPQPDDREADAVATNLV